jgi:hypothetical protein
VLQPVDVSWVRAFKAEFVKRFRVWGSADLEPYLGRLLLPTRGLSAVMMRRGQIVAAACEAALASTQPSLCMRAFMTWGLSESVEEFLPDRPLASRYVTDSAVDPERDGGVARIRRLELSSRLLTADDCVAELRQRAEEKRRWRRVRAPPPEEDPAAAEDEPNFEAADGAEFDGFALAPELTLPPDLPETDAE